MKEHASEIERAERALVDLLKTELGNDVRIEVQPDDPETWDMGTANAAVLVHFAESRPSSNGNGLNAAALAGPTGFAVIVLARSLRGPGGGYALIEDVQQAFAGKAPNGMRRIAVQRARLQGQSGGIWRWIVEVGTELITGRPRLAGLATPVIPAFRDPS